MRKLLAISWLLTIFTGLPQALGQTASPGALKDLGTRRAGVDWPVFLGPTGDSKSTEVGIRKDWSKTPPPIVWQRPLVESYGTCTVSKGRVFQFDAVSAPDGTTGVLWCVNSETGEPLWQYQYRYQYEDTYGYNAGPRASPLVDEGRVYLFGVDGKLICVNAHDGQEIWKVDTNRTFGVVQNFFGVGSNPIVVGDLLVVMVGGSQPNTRNLRTAEGNGSGIVAFDKSTGKIKYQLSDQLASYASLKQVEYAGRPWCFAFMRGGLLVFHPRSGNEDFFYPWRSRVFESVNASVPVVIDNQVFISETYGPGSAMLDFTKQASNVVWKDEDRTRTKSMQTHWNTAIHHDGFIYGSSGRHTRNAELRCIEAATGKVRWSQPNLTRSSLLYVDNHFVCLGEYGTLLLLEANPNAYREVARIDLETKGEPLLRYPAWAAPVLSHGLLYLRGRDRLVCAELIPD